MLVTSRSNVPWNFLNAVFKVLFKCTSNYFAFVLLLFSNIFVVSAIVTFSSSHHVVVVPFDNELLSCSSYLLVESYFFCCNLGYSLLSIVSNKTM